MDITKVSRKNTQAPLLSLLSIGLTACGGGAATIPSSSSSTTTPSTQLSGNVVKGPLQDAFVFLDLNNDGIHNANEPSTYTDSDGAYQLTTTNANAPIVAKSTDNTIDTSSNTSVTDMTLSAPSGATVITPTTTLIHESGLSQSALKAVLGIDSDEDLLSFNPFDTNADGQDALEIELVGWQVMNTINAQASALKANSQNDDNYFSMATDAMVALIEQESNANQTDIKFDDQSILTKLQDKVEDLAQYDSNIDLGAYQNSSTAVNNSIANTNSYVKDNISTDLTSANTKMLLSTASALETQIAQGEITFDTMQAVIDSTANLAPTAISISNNIILENNETLIIGTLSTEDDEPSHNVQYTLQGTDASHFILQGSTLMLKQAADYEIKSSYDIAIMATDEGGKSFTQSLTISVKNDPNDGGIGGSLTITGTPLTGESLSVDTDAILNASNISLQWYSDNELIQGATADTLDIIEAYANTRISVKSVVTDNAQVQHHLEATNPSFVFAAPDLVHVKVDSSILGDSYSRMTPSFENTSTFNNLINQSNNYESGLSPTYVNSSTTTASATGLQINYSDGGYLIVSFTNFSPTSWSEIEAIVDSFQASQTWDDLTISGGFTSAKYYNSAGTKIGTLEYDSEGFTYTRNAVPNNLPKVFNFEGSFNNQIADFINIAEQASAIAEMPNTNTAEEEAYFAKLDSWIEAFTNDYSLKGISLQNGNGDDIMAIRGDSATKSLTITLLDHTLTFSSSPRTETTPTMSELREIIDSLASTTPDYSLLKLSGIEGNIQYTVGDKTVIDINIKDLELALNQTQTNTLDGSDGQHHAVNGETLYVSDDQGMYLLEISGPDLEQYTNLRVDNILDADVYLNAQQFDTPLLINLTMANQETIDTANENATDLSNTYTDLFNASGTGSWQNMLDEYALADAHKIPAGNITLSDTAITADLGNTYKLTMAFENFSPTSLDQLEALKAQATNPLFGGVTGLDISEGFSSLTLTKGGETISTIEHSSAGFVWSNSLAGNDDLGSLKLLGQYPNQLSDFLELHKVICQNGASSDIGLNHLQDNIDFQGIEFEKGDGSSLVKLAFVDTGLQVSLGNQSFTLSGDVPSSMNDAIDLIVDRQAAYSNSYSDITNLDIEWLTGEDTLIDLEIINGSQLNTVVDDPNNNFNSLGDILTVDDNDYLKFADNTLVIADDKGLFKITLLDTQFTEASSASEINLFLNEFI